MLATATASSIGGSSGRESDHSCVKNKVDRPHEFSKAAFGMYAPGIRSGWVFSSRYWIHRFSEEKICGIHECIEYAVCISLGALAKLYVGVESG